MTAQRRGDSETSENDAMIFDTNNPTGGDTDLRYSDKGKVIIISEDNDSSDPDDNAHGGTITFDFDNPSLVESIELLDIEESGGKITALDINGNVLKTVSIPARGDNSAQTIDIDTDGVASLVISLKGSGAVNDLCFKPGDPAPLGSLSGTYFCDDDNDGVQGINDPGIEGVTVELLDANGNGTGITTTTDANGDYSFTGLTAGTYGVKFSYSGDKTLVEANVGNDDTIDSDASDLGGGMSEITGITVVAGENTPGQ